jgi:hypothetical protein
MDISDLDQRIGNLELRVIRSGQEGSDYVRHVQEGLATIEDRLVQQDAESKAKRSKIDDLSHENMGLRSLLNRLLAVIEQASILDLDCLLGNLNRQVETLVELTSNKGEPTTSSKTSKSSVERAINEMPNAEALSVDTFDRQWIKEILDGLYSNRTDVENGDQSEAPVREGQAA